MPRGSRNLQGRGGGRGSHAQAPLICKGAIILPPTPPTSLEINAAQIRQDLSEGVPNHWLPGKPNHQPGRPPTSRVSVGSRVGVGRGWPCLAGSFLQLRAESSGPRYRLSRGGQVKGLGRSSLGGQEPLRSLEQGRDVVSCREPGSIWQI